MSHAEPAAVGAAIGTPTSVISVRPAVLPAPGRGEDLQVRVTAPTTGRDAPIGVFSPGFGSSMDGHAPPLNSGPRTASSSCSRPISIPGPWAFPPEDRAGEDMSDPRAAVGVLLAVAGTGG
jgi:hypothetical protein